MKSKKLIGAFVGIVMSASLAAGLSACATGHTHSWQWKDIGGGEHRQECSCGETGETKPHTDVNGDNKCDDCKIDMPAAVVVTDVSLNRSSATLTVGGETLTLIATVTPDGAGEVTWASSDPTVASVAGGVVTALKGGETVITAKAGDKSATCTVTVNAAAVGLTQAQWEQALNLSGKVGVEQTITGGKINSRTIVKLDGGKTYLKVSEEDFSMEMYIEKTDEENYVYSKGYEYWSKAQLTDEELAEYGIQENFDAGKDSFPFDKFEKGTANGEYVSKAAYTVEQTDSEGEPHTINIKEAKIRFSAEGKVVYAEYVNVEDGVEYKNTMDLTYGETIELPETLEGEKVTEEEMAAALALTDTNYRMGLSAYGIVAFEYRQSGTDKNLVIGAYFSDNTEKDEMYFTKESDKFYRYEGKYGHWSKVELNGMTDQIYASEITGPGYIGIDLSDYPVKSFTYSDEAKSYVLAGGNSMIIATFKNKKLVRVISVEGSNMTTIEFVYGDAQVTMPTIPAGEQVTDGEWAAAQAMNFDNFEVHQQFDSGSMEYKKVGDTVYRKVTGSNASEIYAVKEGDNYYAYAVEQGVWKKEEIEKSDYDSLNIALMFAGATKSDFTWDAASGTYTGTLGNTQAAIKFVDKKIDTVISEYGKIYVNYGTAELTLPKEGSPASGGSIIVGPSKPEGVDMSEDEWKQLFDDVENSEALSVSVSAGSSHAMYTFDGENGYIYVSSYTEDYVYAEDNGKVWKYEYDGEQNIVSKTQTEYNSLEEVKEELFGRFFEGENGAGIKDMYDDFYGENGNYQYRISENEYWSVYVREGELESIGYSSDDGYQYYNFEQEIHNEPNWYLEYEGQIATEEEWNEAFGMDFDRYHVHNGGDRIKYYKDGDNYRVVNDGEDNYFGIEGGTYFHYGYDEQTGKSVKEEIDETAFNTAIQLPCSYDFADFEMAEDEYGRPYYKNADESVRIEFWKNRISRISTEDFMFIYEYNCDELFMPQDKLTEEEWAAAIDEAFDADCLEYLMPHFSVYVDKNAGVINVSDYNNFAGDELYIMEDGELVKYVSNEQGNGAVKQSTDQTFEGLLDWLKAYVLEPDVLNGQSIAENYEHFEHNGLGGYTYVFDTESNSRIEVQFKGGKLWKVEVIFVEEDEEGFTTYDLHHYIEERDSEYVEGRLPYWYRNSINEKK